MPQYFLTNNNNGPIGLPGIGAFEAHETREVSEAQAAQYAHNPEFRISVVDPPNQTDRIGFAGPLSPLFGYGSAGLDLLQALRETHEDVFVFPELRNGQHDPYLDSELVDYIRRRRNWVPTYTIAHTLPDDLPYVWSPRVIAYTMFETDKLPDGSHPEVSRFGNWAQLLNDHAYHVIVPCKHNQEMFRENGVTRPISVLPYGVDPTPWPYKSRADRKPDGKFRVILFGDLTNRKSPFEALQAFRMAFPGQEDVELVLKTQWNVLGYGRHMPIIKDDRVRVINESYTREQLVELLHSCDVLLWLSKGEGFGLPPLQAALTGLPVITTYNTGMAEWFNPLYFYGVKGAGKEEYSVFGNWELPDVEHAAQRLREVYEDRNKSYNKAKKAHDYVRKEFSPAKYRERLAAVLAEIRKV